MRWSPLSPGGWLFAVALDIEAIPSSMGASWRAAIVLRTVVWTAALYVLLFLLTWGLNYRRERLSDKLSASIQPRYPPTRHDRWPSQR